MPDERLHLLQAHRLAEREQLERAELLLAELGEPLADDVDERRARPRAPGEAPEAAAVLQRAVGERAEQQLADVEDVAAAAVVHPAPRRLLDRRPEDGLDEPAGAGLVERAELEPERARVLPQLLDGVGQRLAACAPWRRRTPSPLITRCRTIAAEAGIEQLRVVDPEHDGPARGALAQRARPRCA